MFQTNVHLFKFSSYQIGGKADFFAGPKTEFELREVLEAWRKTGGKKFFILGGGTNVLFGDGNFDGLILRPEFRDIAEKDGVISAGAGIQMSELLDFAIERGLAGLEWAGGLPGTVGGAVRGNAGAFGGEMKDSVIAVKSLDFERQNPELTTRTNPECRFGYRDSIFKHNGEIIIEAKIATSKGNSAELLKAAEEKIKYRKERQPLEYPNAGSIFKNVPWEKIPAKWHSNFESQKKSDPFPVMPAAYLISEAGLKGVSFGGAMISPKHPNFIINALKARSEDVKNLISLAKSEIADRFNVELEEEIFIF